MNTPNENLQHLRSVLKNFDVEAILVPMRCGFDNYDSSVSDICSISGFSGSNGRGVVSQSMAILAVDGRYTTQATRQTDNSFWKIEKYPECTVMSMIMKILKQGDTIAISSMAHSYKSYINLINQIKSAGVKVLTIDSHPVIQYRNQNSKNNKIIITEIENIKNRINLITQKLEKNEAFLMTNKETISWIFGTRRINLGINKNPTANSIVLFTKQEKPIMFSDIDVEDNDFFDFYNFEQFQNVINNFKSASIKINYSHVPAYFALFLIKNGFNIEQINDNFETFQQIKTPKEIIAQKDGAKETSMAFIKMLAYVEYYVRNGEKITEKDAIGYFESKKAIDFSFVPISATGKNTSVVHYVPDVESNFAIDKDTLFLFDAGFHFENSTTDMTRTIYTGNNPPEEFKNVYTAILKSLIHYSMSKFPNNTYAYSLDAICRYHMWQHGLDYDFGTGHGVGNYRSVHEQPRIGKNSLDRITSGMITTVEPGYYRNDYGMRIENMLLSVIDNKTNMIGFESIAYIPFCNCLIKEKMLDNGAKTWLNEYHAEVSRTFLPVFKNDPIVTSWILQNTKMM